MKAKLKIRWSLLPVLALCAACASTAARHPKATVVSVLEQRETTGKGAKVAWNAQSLVEADLDQDGVPDYAVRGTAKDRVIVGIVRGPLVAGSPAWTLEFPVKGGGEDALCSPDAKIALEPLNDESKTLAEHRTAKGTGINLHDDKCDAFHIFWNPEKKKFEWWRL
jgi:hypothetical protein